MNETVTIRLAKQAMKFSAAHFAIFSASERERCGHNFRVEVDIEAHMLGNGMCFDYGIYKDTVIALCRELNEWMILPTRSPYLQIEEQGRACDRGVQWPANSVFARRCTAVADRECHVGRICAHF